MPKPQRGIRRPSDFSPMPDEVLRTTVIPLFETIAERYPDRPAIRSADFQLSYRELNSAANTLAHQISLDQGEDSSPIAFLFEDEVLSIATFMAILKTGRAYVGLDPRLAPEQLRFILEDSTASLLITAPPFKDAASGVSSPSGGVRTMLLGELDTGSGHPNPGRRIEPNAPYSIFYTSGSEGRPKGVLQGHLTRSQISLSKSRTWFLAPSDRVSQLTSVSHAASYSGLWGALLSGAVLCLFDPRGQTGRQGLEWMVNEQLTIFQAPPSVFAAMVGPAPRGLMFPRLRLIALGSEPVSSAAVELLESHTPEDCVLLNYYASTEAGSICEYPVHHGAPRFEGHLPVGYPTPGRQVLLLDADGRERQDDLEGEIAVRSRFLSIGYWRQPGLTAAKFQVDPMDPEMVTFHTGDLGRWRPDGALEVLGRRDMLVKIRGFGVQLEALELALRDLPGVANAAAVVDRTGGRSARLVAYLVMDPGHSFSPTRFRRELSARLPRHAIPSLFVQLPVLPQSGLGKVARRELPPPSTRRPAIDAEYVAPRTETEAGIAAVWESTLGLTGIGVQDSFFELGGDSLSAMEMTLQVENQLGIKLPPSIFSQATIAAMAAAIAAGGAQAEPTRSFVLASHRAQVAPSGGGKRRRRRQLSARRLLGHSYSWSDLDRVLDLAVQRHMIGLPRTEAIQWGVRWTHNPMVLRVLYHNRRRLFLRWLDGLKEAGSKAPGDFGLCVLANMFPLSRVAGTTVQANARSARHAVLMRTAYWRSLAEILDSTPAGSLPSFLQVGGSENLLEAHARGAGVILVSVHGLPGPSHMPAIERYLGLHRVETISWRTPRRQSRYWDAGDAIPDQVADSLNTELGLYAARRLREGGIIQALSDSPDRQGQVFGARLAGRVYSLKAGFAELALSTGAAIIPHWRHCLPDGTIRQEFGRQLVSKAPGRDQQLEDLVQQYALTMGGAWMAHPESVRWRKIIAHLKRPRDPIAD